MLQSAAVMRGGSAEDFVQMIFLFPGVARTRTGQGETSLHGDWQGGWVVEESGRAWMAIVWLTSIKPSWTDVCRLVTKAWMIFQWSECPSVPGKRGGREGGNGRGRKG